MGLFNRKKKKERGTILNKWIVSPYKGTVHFCGTCDYNCFYTYNYDAINDLRLDTKVILEAIPADVMLCNDSGEMQKFTDDSWGVVYSLNGHIVGVASNKKMKIRQYLKDGYTVRVDAVVSYDKYIKAKTLLLGFSEMIIEE